MKLSCHCLCMDQVVAFCRYDSEPSETSRNAIIKFTPVDLKLKQNLNFKTKLFNTSALLWYLTVSHATKIFFRLNINSTQMRVILI